EYGGAADRQWRVEVIGLLHAGAGEVDADALTRAVDRDAHGDLRPAVHRANVSSVMQTRQQLPHCRGCLIEHVRHVGENGRATMLAHELTDFLRTAHAGCEL